VFDLLDGQDELVQVGRLADTAVGMSLVGALKRPLVVAAGQDDDRNPPQALVLLDRGEDLLAALARQVQVEQDQVGTDLTGAAQVAERLVAVLDDRAPGVEPGSGGAARGLLRA